MTRQEFEQIKTNVASWNAPALSGEPHLVVVCADPKTKECVHPDSFGPELAAAFKQRVEALHQATKDRAALVKFITEDFDIEWFDEPEKIDGATPTVEDQK